MPIVRRKNKTPALIEGRTEAGWNGTGLFSDSKIRVTNEYNCAYLDTINHSTCRVEEFRTGMTLDGLLITFSGRARRFPSMSNDREPHFIQRGRKRTVTIGHTDDAVGRMHAARSLFIMAIGKARIMMPSFRDQLVHVRVALAADPYIRDSHNHEKAICDFLQGMRVVDNDSQIECWTYKKAHHPWGDTGETDIFVVRQDLANELIEESNEKFIGLLAGRVGRGRAAA